MRRLCLPEETRRHLRAACRENLLALRAWLDAMIGRPQEADVPPSRPARRRRARRQGGESN
ncbi:MAG: hypothetical protein ACE5IZ_08780 [Dehalococcoidia bacterium]